MLAIFKKWTAWLFAWLSSFFCSIKGEPVMSALSVEVPFPVFYDRAGEPLENGYVWIGQANLNPQTNPIQVYFDKNLTQPAAQPLRTLAGYIANAGTPAQIYVDGNNFSILVQDKNGTMVYNFPDGTGAPVIPADSCGIDYTPPFPSSVTLPVCEKLAETVSVKDFGAVGDGVVDDTAAIQAAIDSGATAVYFPGGTYACAPLSLASNTLYYGDGYASKLKTVTNAFFFASSGKQNITIQNLAFEGDSAIVGGKASQSLVVLRSSTDCTIDSCYFYGGARAINIGNSGTNLSQRILITNNHINNIADTAVFLIRAQDVTVSNNMIDGVGAGGSANFAIGVTIDDGSLGDAVTAIPSRQIVVSNNIIKNLIGDGTSRAINIIGADNIVISNNIIQNIGDVGSQGMFGIRTFTGNLTPNNNNKNISIIGNQLINIANHAIQLNSVEKGIVSGNYIKNWGCNDSTATDTSAVRVGSLNTNVSVLHNHCVAGSGSDFGILHTLASSSNCYIFANVVDANGTSIVEIQNTVSSTVTYPGLNSLLSTTQPGVRLQFLSSTGNANLATSGTEFLPIIGVSTPKATETEVRFLIDRAIKIYRMRVFTPTAPGAGTSRTFTLVRSGVDQPVSVVIANTETGSSSIFDGNVTITAAGLLSIKSTVSGTPAASPAYVTIEYTES